MYRHELRAWTLLALNSAAFAQETLDLEVTIKKVDAVSSRITLEGDNTVREFMVAEDTKILVAGRPRVQPSMPSSRSTDSPSTPAGSSPASTTARLPVSSRNESFV